MSPQQLKEINDAAHLGHAWAMLSVLMVCSIACLVILAFRGQPEDVNPNNNGDVW